MHQILHLPTEGLRDSWLVQYHLAETSVNAHFGGATLVSLGDIALVQSGVYIPRYSSEGIPYVRVDNVRRAVANLSRGDVAYVPCDSAESVPRTAFTRRDDIVVARTGTIGKATIITDNLEGLVMRQHVTAIRPHATLGLMSGYLCLYLNSPHGRKQLMSKAGGSTRLELTNAVLKSLKVPVLPAALQQQYDRLLRDALREYYGQVACINNLIYETDRLLGLSGGSVLPFGAQEPMCFEVDAKQVGDVWSPARYRANQARCLERVRERFLCKTIGSIAAVSRGKGTRTSQYSTDGIPFIRTSSLINGSIEPFPDHYASLETATAFDQRVLDGDILFSIEGKIGQVALATSDFQVVHKNHIERVRLKPDVAEASAEALSGWVYLVLAGALGRMQCEMHAVVQATIPGLGSKLRAFLVPVPTDRASDALSRLMIETGQRAYRASQGVIRALMALRKIQACFDETLFLEHR